MVDLTACGGFNALVRMPVVGLRCQEGSKIEVVMQASGYRNVAIIGDGGMGTVLSILLCEKDIPTRMWGHDAGQLAEIERHRENKRFLPGYRLPESLTFQSRDDRAMTDAELIVSAVPCQYMRGIWTRLRKYVPAGVPIVSVAKGIENGTLLRPTQILSDVLGKDVPLAALSGPTIADELARKLPATACAAAEDEALAQRIQSTFTCQWLRVYTNTDLIGVELAGAMKNVIAIAAGIIDGVGAGDNAKAALLARGLAEITRLGLAMGANEYTFAGLTGLGDLVTTCISPTGRNRSFGERIGRGLTPEQAREATASVIEGVSTCGSVVALAAQYDVEMPITQAVYEVLFENKPVQTAIENLMSRQLKPEWGAAAPSPAKAP